MDQSGWTFSFTRREWAWSTRGGAGITVLNIWYEDLAQEHLCEKLMLNIAHSLGKRIRLRSATYEARRRVLYATLMPSIQRYEQLGG